MSKLKYYLTDDEKKIFKLRLISLNISFKKKVWTRISFFTSNKICYNLICVHWQQFLLLWIWWMQSSISCHLALGATCRSMWYRGHHDELRNNFQLEIYSDDLISASALDPFLDCSTLVRMLQWFPQKIIWVRGIHADNIPSLFS